MTTIKHSRQRDSILEYLAGSKDHPTADTIYMHVKEEFPNISLGTVYRNLALLTEMGQIQKVTVPGRTDRYDYTTTPHYHFICRSCGCVKDLPAKKLEHLDQLANIGFDGIIEGHTCQFFGLCPDCMRSAQSGEAN